jgi:cytochrome b6-f complex iron-sulfur subunit
MEKNKKNGLQKVSGKGNLTRRNFFVSAGNAAIGIAALGSVGVTLDFLSPKVLLELPRRFIVGVLAAMQPNSVTFDAEHRLIVFRDKQGYFYALSAVCTHLGCIVEWKEAGIPGHPEGVIACPCHGSVFSKTGDVVRGPAPRSLDRFKMYLEEDRVIVDMTETVGAEEMILKV